MFISCCYVRLDEWFIALIFHPLINCNTTEHHTNIARAYTCPALEHWTGQSNANTQTNLQLYITSMGPYFIISFTRNTHKKNITEPTNNCQITNLLMTQCALIFYTFVRKTSDAGITDLRGHTHSSVQSQSPYKQHSLFRSQCTNSHMKRYFFTACLV